jgi:hypothetical protein
MATEKSIPVSEGTAGTLDGIATSAVTRADASTGYRQEMVIADDTVNAARAKVTNAAPGSSDYGLVSRVLLYDANGVALVMKAASTPPVAADPAIVVALSPNSPDLNDTVATGTLGALNAAVVVPLAGKRSCSFNIPNTGNLVGSLTAEVSYDGGTTYNQTFIQTIEGTKTIIVGVSSAVSAVNQSIVLTGGETHARVRVAAYTSGTVSGASCRATMTNGLTPVFVHTMGQSVPTNLPAAVCVLFDTSTGQPISANAPLSTFDQGRVLLALESANTFRIPGRAGTAGQKLMSLFNATGSGVVARVSKITVDLVATVIKAVTVLPPVIRVYKVTVLPTNGTAVTKVSRNSFLTGSSSSITVLGDASADGTNSGTALTATLPAGAVLTQEFAPRLITAAGYEMFDRTEFLNDGEEIVLHALEGIVVMLDYTLATQNPTTDMWVVGTHWSEALT